MRRDTIPSLYPDLPQQDLEFNIEPTGSEPFALMFLDALPLQAYCWEGIVVRETNCYADDNGETPGRRDGQRSVAVCKAVDVACETRHNNTIFACIPIFLSRIRSLTSSLQVQNHLR